MEKTMNVMYPCPITDREEFYNLPESEIERFNFFTKSIDFLKEERKAGKKDENGALMYTVIDFSDAFSKFLVNKKVLLLDIDYTLFDERNPRPHVVKFLEKMHQKYRIHFYTAGTRKRVAEVLKILFSMGLSAEIVRHLDRKALTRENCHTIELKSGATIKCLQKAADILKFNVEDLIMLDDNPKYDNPHKDQIIQAEGYMVDFDGEQDDYLLRLMKTNIL